MPFCEPCDKHWAPSAMTVDGACPTCGAVLPRSPLAANAKAITDRQAEAAAVQVEAEATPEPGLVEELQGREGKAPWHFKLLVGALVIYLGFRGVQGVEWVAKHI